MLAPHNVTSTLRMMSDAQLAQYAQMHQNDPYIFPLAFQESQDRKNMRAQQMAKQAGQAQPPVVQQDLAQMMPQRPMPQGMPQAAPQAAEQLPEEQGIGTLPADNLQKMAGGGITGEHHFDEGGGAYNYTALTKADLPTKPSASEVNEYTKQIQEEAERRAAPEQAKTSALFDPYIQKLQAKQADIENRKDTNTQMALLQAGLGMLGGTSPYAFQNIAAGGKEGVAAYISGKKAIQDSQDALEHSQFLAEQAKSAALKGDVRDQIALQNASQSSLMAGKHLDMAGITLLNTSQAKAGELAAKKEENEIKASDVAGKKDYYASEAELNRAKIPSQSDKSNALLDSKINSATLPFKKKISDLLGKPYVNEKAINNLIDEHNAAVDAVYAGHPEAVNKYGHLPKFVAPKDDTEGNESSFWDIFKSKSSTPDNSAAAAAPTAVTPTIAPNPTIGLPAGVPGATTRDGPLPPGMNPNNPKGVKFLGFEQ